jgi:hypothetical protein
MEDNGVENNFSVIFIVMKPLYTESEFEITNIIKERLTS